MDPNTQPRVNETEPIIEWNQANYIVNSPCFDGICMAVTFDFVYRYLFSYQNFDRIEEVFKLFYINNLDSSLPFIIDSQQKYMNACSNGGMTLWDMVYFLFTHIYKTTFGFEIEEALLIKIEESTDKERELRSCFGTILRHAPKTPKTKAYIFLLRTKAGNHSIAVINNNDVFYFFDPSSGLYKTNGLIGFKSLLLKFINEYKIQCFSMIGIINIIN